MNNKQKVYSEFIVRPYSAELYHYAMKHADKDFKYIRKERNNGKWRYYYEDDKSRNPKATRLINKDDRTRFVSNVSTERNPATSKARLLNKDDSPNQISSVKQATSILKDTSTNKHDINSGDSYNPNAKIDNSPIKTINDLPKQTRKFSTTENQNRVNPDYDPRKPEYSENCGECTGVMDLRRRGYDVEVRPDDNSYESSLSNICSWYKNTSIKDWTFVGLTAEQHMKDTGDNRTDTEYIEYLAKRLDETYTDIEDRYNSITNKISRLLKKESAPDLSTPEAKFEAAKADMMKHGEGAYGNFYLNWSCGGAHSVEWSIESGNIMIRDTQVNTVSTIDEYFKKYDGRIDYYGYLRTDNREITDEILNTCRRRRGLNGD